MIKICKSGLLMLGLMLLLPSCVGSLPDESHTFLLRSDKVEVGEVSNQLVTTIASQLENSQLLQAGYPVFGRVVLEPDPSDTSIQSMRCEAVQTLMATGDQCLQLNEQGDFIRAQAITWESAAFFMVRIYVAPKTLFWRVNPAKDFVALDIFVFEELALWPVVDEAIRAAAAGIGARPFRP